MSSIAYYNYDPLTEFYLPLNIEMMGHYGDILYNDDLTRIVYASNDYAFRARTDQNKVDGSLNLPFMSFKRTGLGDPTEWQRWSYDSVSNGLFLSDVGEKVKLVPIRIDFEGAVFTANERDLYWTWKLLTNDKTLRTTISYNVLLNGIEVPNYAELKYDSIDYDPDWNENDWLVQNSIHSIKLNFHVNTFMTEINSNDPIRYSPVDQVIFNFAAKNNFSTNSFEDALTFTVNRFTDEVICDRNGEVINP